MSLQERLGDTVDERHRIIWCPDACCLAVGCTNQSQKQDTLRLVESNTVETDIMEQVLDYQLATFHPAR